MAAFLFDSVKFIFVLKNVCDSVKFMFVLKKKSVTGCKKILRGSILSCMFFPGLMSNVGAGVIA